MTTTLYDDGGIACDDENLLIRRYYPWGAKRIPYTTIKGVSRLPLQGLNRPWKWRIWGSGDFVHWWNLDRQRPRKDLALVIDLGHHNAADNYPSRPRDSRENPRRARDLTVKNLDTSAAGSSS